MDARSFPTARDRRPFLGPSQVIALGLVAAALGWAAWLLRDQPIREETELLAGSVLPSSELALMEAAFDRAQLTDYRTEGGRVYVPRGRQSAYMRALVDAEALPREFGGSLRRALANNSPWQSRSVQAELLRVATQDELSLVLCSMPGIERAAVLYDVEEQSGLSGGTVKTASVSIRTQPDADLDATRIQAIRVLVAASIAGLSPDRVAVTDLRNGRVFAGPLTAGPDEDADPVLTRRLAYERALSAKVRQAIAYVKGAVVDVTVEFAQPAPPETAPDADAAQPPAAANAPAELSASETAPVPPQPRLDRGTALESLHVSVSIPDAYLRALRDDAGADATRTSSADDSELDRIRDAVLRSLPATSAPEGRRVVVTRFPSPGAAPRTAEPQPAADDRAAAPAAVSLEELLGRTVAGDLRFDAGQLPREILVAAGVVVAGLLAAIIWLLGAAGRASSRTSGFHPQIDWSQLERNRGDDIQRGAGVQEDFRAAA